MAITAGRPFSNTKGPPQGAWDCPHTRLQRFSRVEKGVIRGAWTTAWESLFTGFSLCPSGKGKARRGVTGQRPWPGVQISLAHSEAGQLEKQAK